MAQVYGVIGQVTPTILLRRINIFFLLLFICRHIKAIFMPQPSWYCGMQTRQLLIKISALALASWVLGSFS